MFNKMQTDNHNNEEQCHSQLKVYSEKNGSTVFQNGILYILC